MRTLSLLLCCLLATSAWGAGPALVQAEQAFDALEFDTASARFRDALRQPGTREERIRAWRGLALSEAFMGEAAAAQSAFESLLTIEPTAEVSRALGPKVRQPFEAAREAMQGRRGRLKLARTKDGRVVASLEQARPVASELVLYLRQPGESAFTPTRGRAPGPVSVAASPVRSVDAYVVALDAGGGTLFEAGSARAPIHLEATEALLPVASARESGEDEDEAEVEAPKSGGGRVWPWVLAGAGVVAGGVVAGVLLTQPQPLSLPPADRTGQLP